MVLPLALQSNLPHSHAVAGNSLLFISAIVILLQNKVAFWLKPGR
jgi:hypothetical protein